MSALGLTEKMLHVLQLPVGARLSPGLVRVIASHLEPRRFVPGERLAISGDLLDALVMLIDGAVDLSREGAHIGQLTAPQTFGFLGILAKGDVPYDAVARTEVYALELGTDVLLELFEEHFELYTTTLKYLAERLYFDLQDLPEHALGIPAEDLGTLAAKPALDLVDRVLVLRKSSGLKSASIPMLADMARAMEELRAPAGTKLWGVGEPPRRAAFMVGGTLRCRAADGRTFRYGGGTGAGGVECLAERPRWYEAVAETDVVALLGQTEDLLDVFEQDRAMAMDFMAMLARGQLALVERRARLGFEALAVRDVSRLGAVRVGA